MSLRTLTALPVYNEVDNVEGALAGALSYCHDVLVIDDGSTDGTAALLANRNDIQLISHPVNQGYGAALRSAFEVAIVGRYDVLVTIDCDGQHQPQLIPRFVESCSTGDVDIVSGSRYLKHFPGDSDPPADRKRINQIIVFELRKRLGLRLTDAFCGFKAYRVPALTRMKLVETGYAMPLELWVQAARLGLRIVELPVPMIYLDAKRSFGGSLDNAETRLAVYRLTLDRAARRMDRLHLRMIEDNGAMLVVPSFGRVADMVAENRRRRQAATCQIAGRSFSEVSELARKELLAQARRWMAAYRDVPALPNDPQGLIYMAGHQPTMFHPGVWLKNFVLGRLAEKHGATPINLIVDSDVLTKASLQVPGGSTIEPFREDLPFDNAEPKVAYEERRIQDRTLFNSFGRRVLDRIAPLVPHPLISDYWALATGRLSETDNLGAVLTQARHQLEERWGAKTLEVPQSAICSGEAFQWFAVQILIRLAEFRAVYNEALREYRLEHGVRSLMHPAPDLAVDGPWLETPFWVWTADQPHRSRLYARNDAHEIVLTDRLNWQTRLAVDNADRAVAKLLELQRGGIRIRSRALMTTLWARLALSDLFIHGLGGAKYDRVTDRIIDQFFGVQPPGYMLLSATLLLPIQRSRVLESDERSIRCQLREMTYHPERFICKTCGTDSSDGDVAVVPQEVAELVAEKRCWLQTPPTAENARRRCHAIRRINVALQSWIEHRRQELARQHAVMEQALRAERVLAWRDYAFCLYPEPCLCDFFERLLHKIT